MSTTIRTWSPLSVRLKFRSLYAVTSPWLLTNTPLIRPITTGFAPRGTRAARHGLLFTSEGRLNIKNLRFAQDSGPLDPKCSCNVCTRYSRAYLRHLFVSGEPLAGALNTVHNLWFYLDTMRSVRHAISLGDPSGAHSGKASSKLV